MYAAAGGASLAGRKARQHGRQPAPPSPRPHSPLHPAPTGVRAYSCQHWESRLAAPPSRVSAPISDPPSPCELIERPFVPRIYALEVSSSSCADVSEAKCVVDSPRAVQGPWLRLVAARTNGHKPGKYAGSSYAKKQIAGEKKTAFKERHQARPAEQHSDQTDRALPEIPSGVMDWRLRLGMYSVARPLIRWSVEICERAGQYEKI
ncbi:unnamed protein product [Spodoptera exigua]|nr:unnamed protein product [Spodoptera exigua]